MWFVDLYTFDEANKHAVRLMVSDHCRPYTGYVNSIAGGLLLRRSILVASYENKPITIPIHRNPKTSFTIEISMADVHGRTIPFRPSPKYNQLHIEQTVGMFIMYVCIVLLR